MLNNSKKQSIRQAYLKYLKDFQKLCLKFDLNFNITPEKILEIETYLAKIQWPLLEARDIQKTYNHYTWPKFCQKFKFNWELYFKKIKLNPPTEIFITQPSYLKNCLKYLNQLSKEDVQNYLIYNYLSSFTGMIPRFSKLHFAFYSKTLYSLNRSISLKRWARQCTHSAFCDLFGQIYIKDYFPSNSKKDIEKLYQKINQTFANRLQNNGWLSKKSQNKALKKLKNIICIIGYTDYWYDYSHIKLKPNKLIENSDIFYTIDQKEEYSLLQQKPNRLRFGCFVENVQEVNAYANYLMMNIKLPAGILQKPFYDHKADLFYNLGALGGIIGHELTHHFENNGSLHGENGNLNPWLTKKDIENFKKAAQKLIKTANKYQVTSDNKINGQQVINESIADLGGLEIALDIAKDYCQKHDFNQKEIKEALKQVFIAYAYTNSANSSSMAKNMQAELGSHPDDVFRVNGIMSHCDDFYKAFDVKKGDKLYLAPKDRSKIW